MANRQGISEVQGRKVLELAQKSGKPCYVKVFNTDIRREPGKAVLKEVLNDRTALVRPFGHGKDEVENLSDIIIWQSRCEFDATEALKMSATDFRKPLGEKLSIPTSVAPAASPVGEFVIFSAKMKSVWGGQERRWTQNFNLASKWRDHGDGMRAIGKLNKIPTQDDAVLLPISEAYDALLDVLTTPQSTAQQAFLFKSPTPPMVPPTAAQPTRPTAPALSASLIAVARPQPAVQIDLDDDDLIDLDILLGKDNASLKLAEEERRKAAAEYGLAKKAVKEAVRLAELSFKKFSELDQRCAELGGQSSLKTAEKPKQKGKRIFLRSKIQKILLSHSRLDTDSIYGRLKSELPELDRLKVSTALYSMKSDGLAEKNDGGWALTTEGRTAEMMEN